MQHRPRKRFGQNFLQSPQIIESIVQASSIKADDRVIEIGPGQGALTKPLLQRLNQLTVIEIDKDLHEPLLNLPNAAGKLTLIDADALTVSYGEFGQHLKVIGNLPYNISTPLLIHLLHFVDCIDSMVFMLQKEVVERLTASPGSKDYGRLSVMIQYYCDAIYLFTVPPEVFYPKPKVDSAVVRLLPFKDSPYPFIAFEILERVVKKAFSMRRKTLANNLKPLVSSSELEQLKIDARKRPEEISVDEYVQIAKFISR